MPKVKTTQKKEKVGVGNVLSSLRFLEELTVKELAERMGVSSAYICGVEANRKRPSLEKLEEFSKALNVDIHTLIYFNEQGKKCRYRHKELIYEILKTVISKSIS